MWSLNTHKLKGLKSADALDNLNRDADDVLHRMMDESSASINKNLHGHSGPVSEEFDFKRPVSRKVRVCV